MPSQTINVIASCQGSAWQGSPQLGSNRQAEGQGLQQASECSAGSGLGISFVADALLTLLKEEGMALACETTTLVGYSMGARVALEMLCQAGGSFRKAVLLSGTAGIEDPAERERRRLQDDFAAERMRQDGLEEYLAEWYAASLWDLLRQHPRYCTLQPVTGSSKSRRLRVTFPVRRQTAFACLAMPAADKFSAGLGTSKADGAREMLTHWRRSSHKPRQGAGGRYGHIRASERRLCWSPAEGTRNTWRWESTCNTAGEAADLIIVEEAGHALPVECPERILHILST